MNDLVIISGPTATGKSSLAVRLAKQINGSVISADSMQVYRKMDIGTAKISKDEMEGIPHYLIDVLEPWDDFNIVTFQKMAKDAIGDIYEKNRVPMIVGGTGFYIQSVLYDIDFSEEDDDPDYRECLMKLIDDKGSEFVYDILKNTDPKAAEHIHPNDHRRLIRALEYNRKTGRLISGHNEESQLRTSPYNFCYFVLTDDRQKLYDRIDSRVDKMIEAGLVEEVRSLMRSGLSKNNISMHGLGYKEILDHLEGKISLEEAVYVIKRDSRHFAKRQLTWARRERDVYMIDLTQNEDPIIIMMDELKKKGIING